MRIFTMFFGLLLVLPSFAFAVKIEKVDIDPGQPKAGDTVLITVKTDKNATKVEIDFPAVPGPAVKMQDKGGDKWQIKLKMSTAGEKKFKVTAYDKKGKKDSEEKKFVVGGEVSQPKPQPHVAGLNLNGPAYTSENPFAKAGFGGQCTAFAWGRALEVTGKKLDTTKNGKYWYGMTKFPRGQNPKPNSIAVWDGDSQNPYGHVAFVENVDNNGDVSINEANFRKYKKTDFGGGYDGSSIKLNQHQMLNRSGAGRLLGYIYL